MRPFTKHTSMKNYQLTFSSWPSNSFRKKNVYQLAYKSYIPHPKGGGFGGMMVIIIGNGHSNVSSNPGQG